MSMFGSLLSDAKPTEGTGNAPLAPGYYHVAITDVQLRTNNSGWRGFQFEFTVQSGTGKGRKVWHTFTVEMNPTEKMPASKLPEFLAEQKGGIVGVLKAAGHPNPNAPDTAPINGRKLGVKLAVRDRKQNGQPTGEKENTVVQWCSEADVQAKIGSTATGRPAGAGGIPTGMLGMSMAAGAPLTGMPSMGTMSSMQENKPALDDEIPF